MNEEQYKEFLELLAECDKRPKNTIHNNKINHVLGQYYEKYN